RYAYYFAIPLALILVGDQVAAFSSAFQVVTFDHGGVGASEGQPPYNVERGPRTRCGSSITWVSTACIWSDIRPAVPLRKCSQPIIPTVSRPLSSAQLWPGWTRDCAGCSCSASERCTSRWGLVGAARPGTRRRESRRHASTRCSLMTPENACGVSATRRC